MSIGAIDSPIIEPSIPNTIDTAEASIYNVLNNDAYKDNPEAVVDAIGLIHQKGGNWTPDAEDLLAKTSRELTAAANLKPDYSFLASVPPPTLNDTDTGDKQLKAIADWRTNSEATLSKGLGANWIGVRDATREYLDGKAEELNRNAWWKNVSGHDLPIYNYIRDYSARTANGVLDAVGDTIDQADLFFGGDGKNAVGDALKQNFATNPVHDTQMLAKGVTALSSMAPFVAAQVGLTAAAVANIPLIPEELLVAGTAALVGAGTIGISSYSDVYKQVYASTGSEEKASSAAWKAAFGSGITVGAVDAAVTHGIFGKFTKLLSPSLMDVTSEAAMRKAARTGIASALSESNPWAKAAVKGAVSTAGGGSAMFAQSVLNQTIAQQDTGKPIDYSQAFEQAGYGGFAAGAMGAAYGHYEARKENAQIPTIRQKVNTYLKGVKDYNDLSTTIRGKDTNQLQLDYQPEQSLKGDTNPDKYKDLVKFVARDGSTTWIKNSDLVINAAMQQDTAYSISQVKRLDPGEQTKVIKVVSAFVNAVRSRTNDKIAAEEEAKAEGRKPGIALDALDAAAKPTKPETKKAEPNYTVTLPVDYVGVVHDFGEHLKGWGIKARPGLEGNTILEYTDPQKSRINLDTLQLALSNTLKGTKEGVMVPKEGEQTELNPKDLASPMPVSKEPLPEVMPEQRTALLNAVRDIVSSAKQKASPDKSATDILPDIEVNLPYSKIPQPVSNYLSSLGLTVNVNEGGTVTLGKASDAPWAKTVRNIRTKGYDIHKEVTRLFDNQPKEPTLAEVQSKEPKAPKEVTPKAAPSEKDLTEIVTTDGETIPVKQDGSLQVIEHSLASETAENLPGQIESLAQRIDMTPDSTDFAAYKAVVQGDILRTAQNRDKMLRADKDADISMYTKEIEKLRADYDNLIIDSEAEKNYLTNQRIKAAQMEEMGRLLNKQGYYDHPVEEKVEDVGPSQREGESDADYIARVERAQGGVEVANEPTDVYSSKARGATRTIISHTSDKTTNRYSPSINEGLRRQITYWTRGFGLKDVTVYTHEDMRTGGYDKLGDEGIQQLAARAMERSATDRGTISIGKDGKAVILLKDGSGSPDSVLTASHEVAHAVIKQHLLNAKGDAPAEIVRDYNLAMDRIQTKRGGFTGTNEAKTRQKIYGAEPGVRGTKGAAILSKQASDELMNDLYSKEGFIEFLANKLASYINNPGRMPADKADAVYKDMAMHLDSIWKDTQGYVNAPSLYKWFTQNFSDLLAEKALNPYSYKETTESMVDRMPKKPVNKAGIEGSGEYGVRAGAAKVASRVGEAGFDSVADTILKPENALYEQQPHEDTAIAVGKHIDNNLGLSATIKAIQTSDFSRIPLEKMAYFIDATVARLATKIKTGKLASNVKSRYSNIMGNILAKRTELGTSTAQYLESLKMFLEANPMAFASKWVEDYATNLAKEGRTPSKEAVNIINKIISTYSMKFKALEGRSDVGDLHHSILMRNALAEATEKLGAIGALPTTGNALPYFWNMNTLSSPATALYEVGYNALTSTMRTLSTAVATGDINGIRAVFDAAFTGLKRGAVEFHGALAGKLSETSIKNTRLSYYAKNAAEWKPNRTSMTDSTEKIMGLSKGALSYLGKAESLAKGVMAGTVNWTNKNLLRHIADFRRATDVMTLRFNKEVALAANVYDVLKKKNGKFETYEDALSAISDYTLNSKQKWDEALTQAKTEFEDPIIRGNKTNVGENTLQLRAMEILDEQRRVEAETLKKDPKSRTELSVWDSAVLYGKTQAGIQESRGVLGYITREMQRAFNVSAEKMNKSNNSFIRGTGSLVETTAKQFTRYMMVSSNLLTNQLDYTPIGIVRGMLGEHIGSALASKSRVYLGTEKIKGIIDPRSGKEFVKEVYADPAKWSDVESRQRIISGVAGTAAMYTLFQMASAGDDHKGKQKRFDIYGAGPSNPAERATWLASGGVPYSVQVGDKAYSYKNSPAALPLMFLGHLRDQKKYNLEYNKADMAGKGLLAAMAMPNLVLSQTNVKNLIDLVKSDKGPGQAVGQMASFGFQGFIPLSGMWKSISNLAEPNKLDYKYATSIYLTNIPFAQSMSGNIPALNIFGESLPRNGRLWNNANPDPVIKALVDRGLTISAPSKNIVIGGNMELNPEDQTPIKNGLARNFVALREKDMHRLASNMLTEHELAQVTLEAGPKIKAKIGSFVESLPADMSAIQQDIAQKRINKVCSEEINRAKLNLMRADIKARQAS